MTQTTNNYVQSRTSHPENFTFTPIRTYDIRFTASLITSRTKISFSPTPSTRYVDPKEEALIMSCYDIVPERTTEDSLRDFEVRMARVRNQLHEYVDIDIPFSDDGGDW